MQERPTLIALLASHDSTMKHNELVGIIQELHKTGKDKLGKFRFLITGGTFERLILKEDTEAGLRGGDKLEPLSDEAIEFIRSRTTVLPDRKHGGVTILANLIVQRQCSIIWPFLSPITVHWLNPENLALMRLCDLWNAKRLMNAASVRAWFRDEADRDASRNPQPEVLKMNLSTSHEDKFWPEAVLRSDWDCYEMKLPDPKKRKDFWAPPGEQTIALIAHDAMKDRMVDFAVQYENELSKFKRILATGTTGKDVEDACRKLRDEKKICKCLSGPKGGDIEIATEIVYGRCHVVVFFVDPMHPHAHIDDIRVVFSACMAEIDNNDVRMLTNEVQAREWMEEAVRRRPS